MEMREAPFLFGFCGAKRPLDGLPETARFEGAFDGPVAVTDAGVEILSSFPIESAELGEIGFVEVVLGGGEESIAEDFFDFLGALGFAGTRGFLFTLGICTSTISVRTHAEIKLPTYLHGRLIFLDFKRHFLNVHMNK